MNLKGFYYNKLYNTLKVHLQPKFDECIQAGVSDKLGSKLTSELWNVIANVTWRPLADGLGRELQEQISG